MSDKKLEDKLFVGVEPNRVVGPRVQSKEQRKAAKRMRKRLEEEPIEGPMSDAPFIDKLALATAPIPIAGDITGGVADTIRIMDNPTPQNITLGAIGMLPFIPSGGVRVIRSSDEVSDQFKGAVDKAIKRGANDSKSREALVEMEPDDFRQLVKPGFDPEKSKRLSNLEEGEKLEDLPTIYLDDTGDLVRVTGHEGRHRMEALKRGGVKKVPVSVVRSMNRGELQPPNEVLREGMPRPIDTDRILEEMDMEQARRRILEDN